MVNFEPNLIKNVLFQLSNFPLKDKFADDELERFCIILCDSLNQAYSGSNKKVTYETVKLSVLDQLEDSGKYFYMYNMQDFFPVDDFLKKVLPS